MSRFDHNDNVAAVAIPVILYIATILLVVLSFPRLRSAWDSCRHDGAVACVLFFASLAGALLSSFLFFTAAWGYGLICIVVFLLFAVVYSTPEAYQRYGRQVVYGLAAWLGIMVGIPELVSRGVFRTVASSCVGFYQTQAVRMCKEGWITYCLIVSMILVAMVFLAFAAALHRSLAMDDSISVVKSGDAPVVTVHTTHTSTQHRKVVATNPAESHPPYDR